MEKPGFKERRAFKRIPVEIRLRYKNVDLKGEAFAQTQNVSANGICMITKEALPAKTPLEIWLQVPDTGEQIYIKGIVVWSSMIEPDKYKAGVKLENPELNPIALALKSIQANIKH